MENGAEESNITAWRRIAEEGEKVQHGEEVQNRVKQYSMKKSSSRG
jgi:predicted transcriptional regulator